MQKSYSIGFTLIELSIVLVIIGLIVGGVLAGQSLISAAAVRAQISQIEKFNTATNTFRVKYGYLPGDIKDPDASNFGFLPRGNIAGQGNGDGLLQGWTGSVANDIRVMGGEEGVFWVDLSTAKLIEGSFSAATFVTLGSTNVSLYLPQSKLGTNGFVYVYSGGFLNATGLMPGDATNYYGLSAGARVNVNDILDHPLMTPAQAQAIDKKMDDGLPQSGNVTAMVQGEWFSAGTPIVAEGDYDQTTYGPITTSTTEPYWADQNGAATQAQECYYNGDSVAVPETYNLAYPNNVNCALSFRFQ